MQLAPQKSALANLPEVREGVRPVDVLPARRQRRPATSPEGCPLQAGAPTGGLAPTKNTAECQAGIVGYAVNYGVGTPAEFVSEPLKAPLTIGGESQFTFYLVSEAQPATGAYGTGAITYALDAITSDGKTLGVAGGDLAEGAVSGPTPSKSEYPLVIPPTAVPAGATLRLRLSVSCFCTSTTRFLYGGEFADAGLKTGIGSFKVGGATTGAPKPASAPKPVVKGEKQLPATGVGAPSMGYLFLLGAAVIASATRRSRRARPVL